MKNNAILSLLFIPAILVLSACGSEDQAVEGQAKPVVAQYLPKKNSIVIPKSLLGYQEESSERAFRAIDSGGEADSAFTKVNKRVTEAEVIRLSHQVPLLMLDAVWSEIESQCKGVVSETACTIPQGMITLQLTDDIIAAEKVAVEKIDTINNSQQSGMFGANGSVEISQLPITPGEGIELGTIVYTAFSAESEFQYEVSLDLSEMEKMSGLVSDDATIFLLKWAANKRSVVSSYAFENSDKNFIYTYSYLDDGNDELVEIKYSNSDNVPEKISNTETEIITFKALDDSNNTALIGFEGRYSSTRGLQSFSAVGQANNDSGSLQADFSSDYGSEGEAELISYSKRETFANNKGVINSKVCEANCANESAWKSAKGGDSTNSSGNTNTINGDKNEVTITETVTESPLINISVSGLDDGSYIIASDGFDGSIENKLGYGWVAEGIAEFLYWGSEAEIESAKIYTTELVIDGAEYRFTYIEVSTAQIAMAEGTL